MLLEAEAQPGHHATGRSAAFWTESYGGPAVQPLTSASGPWLAERGFLSPRGAIHLADRAHAGLLAALVRDFPHVAFAALDRPALAARLPGLRPGWDHGLDEPSNADIDVAALHAAYLKRARQAGARLLCDAPLRAADHAGRWALTAGHAQITADILVDAAGAWADPVAVLAGVRPLGIAPYRRTIVQLRVDPAPPADLPLLLDAAGRFYLKTTGSGQLWLSPHDETPCAAGDAAPEELDIAIAIDRMEQAFDWRLQRVEHSWAGLRSFAPDRLPVYGFDPRQPAFFWCAGQGGFGIQTAPAGAKLAAGLLLGRAPDAMVAGIDPAPFDPARFG